MTGEGLAETAHFDAHDLGPQLEPALIESCNDKLHDVHWFRVDWQRGGAATAYGKYRWDDGTDRDVVIKFPVGPTEFRFTTALAETDAPTPRLAAFGRELGGHDFAWLVMERLPGDPLAARLHKDVFRELAAACASFSVHANKAVCAADPAPQADWGKLLEHARAAIRDSRIPDEQRWSTMVREVQRHLPQLQAFWRARDCENWCHGDLHAGNLMRRGPDSPWGPDECVLLDLAEVHHGHWVEDGVYLERLYWGREEVIKGIKPVSLVARARRDRGLDTAVDDYARIANVRRVLLAACVPAFLHREGHPLYLAAALRILERLVPVVT